MSSLIPSKEQWKHWTLPSKHTAIGALLGLISILITLYLSLFSSPKAELNIIDSSNMAIHNGTGDINIEISFPLYKDTADKLQITQENLDVSEKTFNLFLKILQQNQVQEEQITNKLLEINNEFLKLQDQIKAYGPEDPYVKIVIENAKQNIEKKTSLNISDGFYNELTDTLIERLTNLNKQREFVNKADNLLKLDFMNSWMKHYETIIDRIDSFVSKYQIDNPDVTIEKFTDKTYKAGIVRAIEINKSQKIEINFIEPQYKLGKMTQSMRLQFLLNREEQFSINIYEDKDNLINYELQVLTPHFENYAISEEGKMSFKFDDCMINAIEKILYLAHL